MESGLPLLKPLNSSTLYLCHSLGTCDLGNHKPSLASFASFLNISLIEFAWGNKQIIYANHLAQTLWMFIKWCQLFLHLRLGWNHPVLWKLDPYVICGRPARQDCGWRWPHNHTHSHGLGQERSEMAGFLADTNKCFLYSTLHCKEGRERVPTTSISEDKGQVALSCCWWECKI